MASVFRRLLRRRVAGVQAPAVGDGDDREDARQVYHVTMQSDGPVPLFAQPPVSRRGGSIASQAHGAWLRLHLDGLRTHARNYIADVGDEEHDTRLAWARLQRVYEAFLVVQQSDLRGKEDEDEQGDVSEKTVQSDLRGKEDEDEQGDVSEKTVVKLLRRRDTDPQVIRDVERLTSELPHGFSSEMFVALGDALFCEMAATPARTTAPSPSPRPQISRVAYEALGAELYAQASSITVSA
ncbi:hypothetical protein P43SY_009516 [Pythium insidiosum]|uniref:Uncharacterized protein n=1 Tax=Pythium insidiosum TaxID=114742 RepID=A0AAD5Q634_PYTIN|nr:hypothetical protein P43SY_009516 [Pythium insidiosum]